jgi:hypothetical protein
VGTDKDQVSAVRASRANDLIGRILGEPYIDVYRAASSRALALATS